MKWLLEKLKTEDYWWLTAHLTIILFGIFLLYSIIF